MMRDLLTTFINALLSAQADAVCGAGYGERSSERVNSRNGYRQRDLDTRVGIGRVHPWGTAGACASWSTPCAMRTRAVPRRVSEIGRAHV